MNQPLDLLFCCGGLMWLAAAAHYCLLGQSMAPVWVVAGLTHLFADTHVAATWHKLFAERRFEYDAGVVWSSVVTVALLVVSIWDEPTRAMLFRMLPLVVIPHYGRQAYGIALMYCYRNDVKLSEQRKRLVCAVFNVAAVSLMARQLSDGAFEIMRIDYHRHVTSVVPMWFVNASGYAAVALACFWLVDHFRYSVRERMPVAGVFLTLSTLGLMLAPNAVARAAWVYAPMLFHGTQYLAVAAQEETKRNTDEQHKLLLDYFGKLFVIAALIYALIPHLSAVVNKDWQSIATVILACVTMHHGLVDAFIWRRKKSGLKTHFRQSK